MKAPLRAAAKVAEKLRNWFTSELEPHGIFNIDHYAHHVVTILLNEDLDIEDEPVETDGDFLKDIFSLRSGKSLERKKKAAVDLLKSVISCDQPVEKQLQKLIDELIVRIQATKDDRPSQRKLLLGPLTVGSHGRKQSSRNRFEEERRYNEAFPSLPGEMEKLNKNKEFERSGKQVKSFQSTSSIFIFSDVNEKEACITAREVFSLAISDSSVASPLSMEIEPSKYSAMSSFSQTANDFDICWKSAFQSVVPTKLFFPNTKSLSLHHDFIPSTIPFPTTFKPLIIPNNQQDSFRILLKYRNLHDPSSVKVFLHPEQESLDHRPSPEMLFARDANDLEVANIIAWAEINREQMRRQRRDEELRRMIEEQQTEDYIDLEHSFQPPIEENGVLENFDGSRDDKVNNNQKDLGRARIQEDRDQLEQVQFDIKEQVQIRIQEEIDDQSQMIDVIKEQKMAKDAEKFHSPSCEENASTGDDEESEENSPLVGAVGGVKVEDIEGALVDTDDVLSFALRQLAKYELKHGKMVEDVEVAKLELDTEETDKCQKSMCSSRIIFGSIDSGMFVTGEEESGASVIEVSKLNGDMAVWRKTPGRPMSKSDSTLSVEDAPNNAYSKSVCWNAWTDPLAGYSWDSMVREELFQLITPARDCYIPAFQSTDYGEVFRPPDLSTCVDTNVSRLLQSAFVNSIFAEVPPSKRSIESVDSSMAVNCSDLERIWMGHSNQESALSAHQDLVRGRTCSKWLENNCDLGGACPFSHPSL